MRDKQEVELQLNKAVLMLQDVRKLGDTVLIGYFVAVCQSLRWVLLQEGIDEPAEFQYEKR